MPSEISVSVSVPVITDRDERRESVSFTLDGEEVTLRLGYQDVRVEFDHLADAFAVLRAVHSSELRTVIGHAARDLIGGAP